MEPCGTKMQVASRPHPWEDKAEEQGLRRKSSPPPRCHQCHPQSRSEPIGIWDRARVKGTACVTEEGPEQPRGGCSIRHTDCLGAPRETAGAP